MDSRLPSRIALFGGSFDPVHLGHLAVADAARRACQLERVVFVPCQQSPLKWGATCASAHDRFAMLRAAIETLPWADVSDIELNRPAPSFSWQTAEAFHDDLPHGGELFWIMGADQWNQLDRWARADRLAELLTFIVIARGDIVPAPREGFRSVFLAAEHPASATEARRRLAAGSPPSSLADLLPDQVIGIISERGLYR